MGLESVISKLKEENGVRAVFHLTGEHLNAVVAEEQSVDTSSMGMPLVNRALEESLKRNTFVCIFCEYSFEHPTDHVMIMEDKKGNIVGHDVPECMMNKFKDDPDIIWLCDDFAIYPQNEMSEEVVIVMLPQKATIIGAAEGAEDPVILYPATTTDMLLREIFGTPEGKNTATTIIAFNT